MGTDSIFVTGATGYVGGAMVERLIENDYDVVGLARSEAAAAKLAAMGATVLRGDLTDAASVAEGCRNADGVVHAAMQWGPGAGETDRAAVAAMLDTLAGTNKPFLYTSGIWVMGDTGGRLAGEMFACKPPALVAWRVAVEKMVLDAAERGIRSMVLRVASVYGRGGGSVGKMAAGQMPLIGDGGNHWSFVHVEDLADLYVAALERGRAGHLYIGASGQPLKVSDVAAAAGVTDRITLEEARARMGLLADALVMDQRVGSTKAGRELGWIPKGPSVFQVLASGMPTGRESCPT